MAEIENPLDEAPPEPQTYLGTEIHCIGCGKNAPKRDLGLFVILFWSGNDPQTGEPIVRDGVFDEKGNVALLRACPGCGPKVLKLHKEYTFEKMGQLWQLNDGPLKKMLSEIWPRRKKDWKFEIGWQIMLPLMMKARDARMSKLAEVRKDDLIIDKMKFNAKKKGLIH